MHACTAAQPQLYSCMDPSPCVPAAPLAYGLLRTFGYPPHHCRGGRREKRPVSLFHTEDKHAALFLSQWETGGMRLNRDEKRRNGGSI